MNPRSSESIQPLARVVFPRWKTTRHTDWRLAATLQKHRRTTASSDRLERTGNRGMLARSADAGYNQPDWGIGPVGIEYGGGRLARAKWCG